MNKFGGQCFLHFCKVDINDKTGKYMKWVESDCAKNTPLQHLLLGHYRGGLLVECYGGYRGGEDLGTGGTQHWQVTEYSG